ncbi:hypothetical protein FPC831_1350009 [Flavobacterium psychrophilum]|nr:hypothetical protein FPSM_00817 [Flavobacterium psychrophilum]SNB00819.1 hypothetical protein FPC831_1350009 [Flavobacterium psychrophilum]
MLDTTIKSVNPTLYTHIKTLKEEKENKYFTAFIKTPLAIS